MGMLSLTDILDDLRAAEDGLHKFERRYWISSEQFFQLYQEGVLDDGDHLEDFAEWVGHYRLRAKRQEALDKISKKRLADLRRQAGKQPLRLTPAEPILDLS
jgi:hypothetical protein